MSNNLEQTCLNYTYNLLKRTGGVTDYKDHDISESSFDQRKFMHELPNNTIKIPANIASRLAQVHKLTESMQKEIPFFIFAHDGRNNGNDNEIIIDEIVFSEEDLNTQSKEAHFGGEIINLLTNKINEHKNDPSFVVIQGHSHPSFQGDIANMYSIQDLSNLVFLNKQTNVQFGACVMTPDKKINMCFYDPVARNFYKGTNFKSIPPKKGAINILEAPLIQENNTTYFFHK